MTVKVVEFIMTYPENLGLRDAMPGLLELDAGEAVGVYECVGGSRWRWMGGVYWGEPREVREASW